MTRGVRLAALSVLVLAAIAAWHWRGVFDPQALIEMISRQPAAPLMFLAIHIGASLVFVPRTLLAVVAGVVFGMWWGVVWAAIGSVAGAAAGFLVARHIDAGFVARANPTRLAALFSGVERGGWRMVALVRLVPIIPHSLTNYALGVTRVGLWPYVVGSLIGQLPLTVAYADIGAAGGRALFGGGIANWRHDVLWPTLIGIAALVFSLAVPALARRRLRTQQA